MEFTIAPENVVPGLILDFEGAMSAAFVPVWEARVEHVEPEDGLGGLGFYVTPAGEEHDVYVPADMLRYRILG